MGLPPSLLLTANCLLWKENFLIHSLWSVPPKGLLCQATGFLPDHNDRAGGSFMPKVWGSILKGFPSFLIDLSVSAQGSSIPKTKQSKYGYISEPVGGSAPKFSEKSSGFVLAEKSANPFSLACPAQGSPTPGFGSVGQLIFLAWCYGLSN